MKKLYIFVLWGVLMQSCALITSRQSFQLERSTKTSFDDKKVFKGFSDILIFFEDGTFLSIKYQGNIDEYVKNKKYKIYNYFDDDKFVWGVYRVDNEIVTIETLEKVHQWGVLNIFRWKGKIEGDILCIYASTEVDKNQRKYLNFREGEKFNKSEDIFEQISEIESKKAWVNSLR